VATTGPKLTIPFVVGAGKIVGQGNAPELWAVAGFEDMTVQSPRWIDVTARVRDFSVSRGRESEQSEHDAGTLTLVLDNRDRAFDPTNAASPYYPNVTPMARLWLREQFTGETKDLFRGYAEAWESEWPNGGWSDATVTVPAADEFKLLALDALPTTSPPRDSYESLIASDDPAGHWRMNDDPVTRIQSAEMVIPNPVPEEQAITRRRRSHWSEDDIH
jgi:hypothetical protein